MPDIIHYAIPFFIITMMIEGIVVQKKKQFGKYTLKDTVASLSMGIGSQVVKFGTVLLTVPAYMYFEQFALFDLKPVWWTWLLLLFLEDFCYYLFHRTSHECRLFWAAHVNHHSSEKYNLSTALRQTWTGAHAFIFWIPLVILGFPAEMIVFQKMVSLLYQYWIHTEQIGHMGILEKFMNTPSHHRVHHGSDIKYLDRNHAGIFIIWDKLLGTFKQEEETPKYGLTKNLESFNPFIIAFHEWKDMLRDVWNSPSVYIALCYIFKPPGWSHDGSRKTSEELRAELQANHS